VVHHKPIDSIAIIIAVILCLSWAFQQITVKFALPELGPLAQGAIRGVGATVLVAMYMYLRAYTTPWVRGLTWPGLVAGFLFGGEFMLLYVSLQYTDASRAIMFLYTAPFVVALGGHLFLPGERLNTKATIGVVLAFAGVAFTMDSSLDTTGLDTTGDMWKGDLMALGSGIGWGLTTLVIRGTSLRSAPASQVLLYQLAMSAVMFTIAAVLVGEKIFVPMSAITIAAVAYQTIWVAAITFGIWFALIATYSATGLSVITFLTPLFGAGMGYLFLGESLGVRHIIAVVAIAVGIFLVSLPRNVPGPIR
jgi:drug/metabolite transporter (DMT)-like permease